MSTDGLPSEPTVITMQAAAATEDRDSSEKPLAHALDAAAGRLSEGEAEKVYAGVEKLSDPLERRNLRRKMIWMACEHRNLRYIQFVWGTFSHPFSESGDFADATVAALKDSGHQDADRHHGLLKYVADTDAAEDTWRGDYM